MTGSLTPAVLSRDRCFSNVHVACCVLVAQPRSLVFRECRVEDVDVDGTPKTTGPRSKAELADASAVSLLIKIGHKVSYSFAAGPSVQAL